MPLHSLCTLKMSRSVAAFIWLCITHCRREVFVVFYSLTDSLTHFDHFRSMKMQISNSVCVQVTD